MKTIYPKKTIVAVLDALKLGYEIDDYSQDETERLIMANSYLAEKITQGRKDMKAGNGITIAFEDTWK